MKSRLDILLLCLALAIAAILTITGCALPAKSSESPSISSPSALSASAPAPSSTGLPPISLSDSPLALEALLETLYLQVNPSVVNIEVLEKAQSIFSNIPGLQITPEEGQLTRALASGFVWDMEGHIITNNHVVENVESISVTFSDGNTYPASIVGADPDSDLAVIKVDVPSDQLLPVKMGDSSQLKVGQLAIAIGNPFGLQSTMTVGFISALGRLLPADENDTGSSYSIPDIVQTDASLNPGNSGGVLINASGMVIGVTTAIATRSGSSAGVGFAVPSAIVQKVVPCLIKNGRFEHPWLGLSLITLTPDINKAMNFTANQKGVLVAEVVAGGPADQAGLVGSSRKITINGASLNVGGDIILAYDGKSVKGSDDLITYLSESGTVGQTVTLTVLRNGQKVEAPVTLGARPK